jgi:hypothetical protein
MDVLRSTDTCHLIIDPERSDREFLSKRRPLNIPRADGEAEYISDGSEKLWQIAARSDVYGDPRYWWILADANRISSIFGSMYRVVESGVPLRVPSLELVRRVISKSSP